MAVAADHGVRARDPVVIHDSSNLLVHLRPAPVVARAATTTGLYRPGPDWLAREVAVAAHLAAAGAAVVAPSDELPPGPHVREGLALSFWRHVEPADAPADGDAAGTALRELHAALESFGGELPELAGPREAERMIPVLVERGLADDDAASLLSRAARSSLAAVEALGLPSRPLHGDAHIGNAFATREGVLWGDWEDTFSGPAGWDLACLAMPALLLGRDVERVESALAAYGGAPPPGELVEARAVQIAVWTLALTERLTWLRERADRWLAWARERYS